MTVERRFFDRKTCFPNETTVIDKAEETGGVLRDGLRVRMSTPLGYGCPLLSCSSPGVRETQILSWALPVQDSAGKWVSAGQSAAQTCHLGPVLLTL